MVSPTGAHRVAPLHSAAGRREGSLGPDGVLGIQGAANAQVGTRRILALSFGVKNKESESHSVSLFQVNTIGRDVKGLFLGVTFMWGIIVVRLKLEDELHVQVGCRVRDGPGPVSVRVCLRVK